MVNPRILIVDDDFDIATVIQIYFSGMNYEVEVAMRGSDALEKTKQLMPHAIVLDVMLPDRDGYDVCQTLRMTRRTSHTPVIFLTQKDERRDKLQGFEVGADYYVTLPFDIEELEWIVRTAVRRFGWHCLTDPRSGLPAGTLIEEQLRRILLAKGWAILDAHINNFEAFQNVYGFVAGDDVLRFTSMLICEVVDECGSTTDFIGHASGDNFIVVTKEENASAMRIRLKQRFNAEVLTHYSFMDRQRGFMEDPSAQNTTARVPFMTISAGIVSSGNHSFDDIHDIARLAIRACLQDQ